MFWNLYVLELLRCVQLRFVTLRHVTFTLCCFTLCSNIVLYTTAIFWVKKSLNQFSIKVAGTASWNLANTGNINFGKYCSWKSSQIINGDILAYCSTCNLFYDTRGLIRLVASMHCKATIPKIRNKHFQKWNCSVSFPILHSCFLERFTYSHDRSVYSAAGK